MPNPNLPDEDIQKLLMDVVDHFHQEDRSARERQIRKCKRLKLMWDNIFQAYYSEIAHDWRIWEGNAAIDTNDQAFYDKPINVFKAYIETVIAALSVTTPKTKCFPEDADSTLDVTTAKAGDKIGQLIARHNNDDLAWLKALYTFFTEGTVFSYSYSKSDKKFGTYTEQIIEDEEETREVYKCPNCGQYREQDEQIDAMQPENQELAGLCSFCGEGNPELQPMTFVTTKIVGEKSLPKSRVCSEVYGGLYVKIGLYAKKQSQTPYLILTEETHYVNAIEQYENIVDSDLIQRLRGQGGTGSEDPYTSWGRLNTMYQGEDPNYIVSHRRAWLRPCAFNVLGDEADVKELKKLYPRGVKVCLINDTFAAAYHEDLDDYWEITVNPTEDYLVHDPAGAVLVPVQEMTNDIVSLGLQTIEHGIGQTFADPGVLNFTSYRDTETLPGGVYEATPKSGRSMADAFYQMKTATLNSEILEFFNIIQSLGQLVSGALPSLFGGQLEGSDTASEYSMSRAQALQRVQNTWKIFTAWWKEVKGKQIPMFINGMKADEKEVVMREDGSFMNSFIRRAELEGRIGKIELEASENLPLTWNQINDKITKLFEMQNPIIMQMLSSPENIPLLRDALGLVDFHIPGEEDVEKQNDEIRQLLQSEPILMPPPSDPVTGEPIPDPQSGMPMEEQETPSVEIDPIYDNHAIQFEVVRKWAVSEAGRQAKVDNPLGYKNVLLHGAEHQMEMMRVQQQQAMMNAVPGKAKGDTEQPVTGDENVPAAV